MERKVRAKFRVTEITKSCHNPRGAQIKLEAVSDAKGENASFWDATPQGTLTMYITRDDDFLRLGDYYYLDFSFSGSPT